VYTTVSNHWPGAHAAGETKSGIPKVDLNLKKRIKFAGGRFLIAASLGLIAACSLEPPTASQATPPPTAAVNKAATPIAHQATPQPTVQSPEDEMPRVNGKDAIELVKTGRAVVVDVRSVDVYKVDRIKGALSLPIEKIAQGDFKAMREDGTYMELPRDKHIISYCT
jgi:hypothetical protein